MLMVGRNGLVAMLVLAVALAGCSSSEEPPTGEADGHDHGDHDHGADGHDHGADEGSASQDGSQSSSGSQQERAKLDGTPIDEPASGKPTLPSWQVGDYWNYTDGDGTYQKVTVAALDQQAGYDTYRISTQRYPSGQQPTGALWIDRDTLGVVAFEVGGDVYETGCSFSAAFPMKDFSQECTSQTPVGPVTIKDSRTLGDWFKIPTPKGDVTAIQINYKSEPGRDSRTWYSPDLGNRAAFDQENVMWTIVDWRVS